MITATSDFRQMITEVIDYRELLLQMTKRDLLLRYKQTVMGFAWAIFMPLVNTIVFSVIFTRVAPLETRVPYPLFAFCGLLAWNFFASALRFSVLSLTNNESLVTKVYFPREIFPFSAVIVSLIDSTVASIVLLGMIAYYGIPIGSAALFLPVVVLVQVAFTTAVALVLSMANLFYRDVKFLFEIVITVWMFATSVVYPLDRVGGVAGTLLRLNPMSTIVDAYRHVLLYQSLPPAIPFAVTAFASLVLLIGAWRLFHSAEYAFAENI